MLIDAFIQRTESTRITQSISAKIQAFLNVQKIQL